MLFLNHILVHCGSALKKLLYLHTLMLLAKHLLKFQNLDLKITKSNEK